MGDKYLQIENHVEECTAVCVATQNPHRISLTNQ